MFVIDGHNHNILELYKMTNEDELISKSANKQDLLDVLSIDIVKENFIYQKRDNMNTKWHLQAISAVRTEGFEWLATTVNNVEVIKDDLLPIWDTSNVRSL